MATWRRVVFLSGMAMGKLFILCPCECSDKSVWVPKQKPKSGRSTCLEKGMLVKREGEMDVVG